ncbi:MAG: hypothetical protein H7061_13365 [Bdellovibrionaceae bacterium]|nr:hypothetical protein [Bdellovibrio sp.]
MKSIFMASLLLLGLAAAASNKSAGDVRCSSGSDERTLSIVAKGEGCELQYMKAGKTSTIASQNIGTEKCDNVLTKVEEKLISTGFTCE